jgi:hypothetical protein
MASKFNCEFEHAKGLKLEDTPICMQDGLKSLNRKGDHVCTAFLIT